MMTNAMINNKALYEYKSVKKDKTKEVKEISFSRFLIGLFDLKGLSEEINAVTEAAYRER